MSTNGRRLKRFALIGVLSLVVAWSASGVASERTLEVWGDLSLEASFEGAELRAENFRQLFVRFTEETGISVRYSQDLQSYEILERLERGEGPDVILSGEEVELLGVLGHLVPINEYVDAWDGRQQIFPRLLPVGAGQAGNTYGVPYTVHIFQGTAYSPALFAESGLDPNTPPDTWSDLADKAARLTRWADDDQPTQLGFDTLWDLPLVPFSYFITQAGGGYASDDLRQFTFHEEAGQRALSFASELYQSTYPNGHQARIGWRNFENVVLDFADERVGMWLMPFTYPVGLSVMQHLHDDWTDSMRFFVSRPDAESDPTLAGYREIAVVPVTAADPDLSWELVSWLGSAEIVGEIAYLNVSLPTRVDVFHQLNEGGIPVFSSWYEALWHVQPSSGAPPFMVDLPMEQWEADILRTYAGDLDVEGILDLWHGVFQAELDKAWDEMESGI